MRLSQENEDIFIVRRGKDQRTSFCVMYMLVFYVSRAIRRLYEYEIVVEVETRH